MPDSPSTLNSLKINFATGTDSSKKNEDVVKQLFVFTTLGRHILIVTEAILLAGLAIEFYFHTQSNSLDKQIKNSTEILALQENQELLKEHRRIQGELTKISEITNKQVNWGERLDKINAIVPEDMTLESYKYEADKLNLKASVKSTQGFALFLDSLIRDESIKSIIMNKSTFDRIQQSFSFDFTMEVK